MPAPTNPRKKSLMPSTPLRRSLRGAGHSLSPIVQIGKEGVSPALVAQVAQALRDHELVKVKIASDSPEDRFEAAERLGAEPGTQVAQILGRTILLYKRNPQKARFEPSPKSSRPEPRGKRPGRTSGKQGKAKAKERRQRAAGRRGG